MDLSIVLGKHKEKRIDMRKAIFFTIGWMYLLTFQLLFTAFGNIICWITSFFKYSRKQRRAAKIQLKCMKQYTDEEYSEPYRVSLSEFLGEYGKYSYDGIGWPAWTKHPVFMMMQHYKEEFVEGNCMDFAFFCKTILKNKMHCKIRILVPLSIKKLNKIHYILDCGDFIFSNIYRVEKNIDQYIVARNKAYYTEFILLK